MKTILVTGATGFVGACLVHRLVKTKCEIHIVTRTSSNKWRIRDLLQTSVNEHECDLRDRDQVARIVEEVEPSIIYHLATYGAYHFENNPEDMMTTNVFGTLNLLNSCQKAGFDHFVYAGSSSEYGIKSHPMRETDALDPIDFYGVTKATATLLCRWFARNAALPISVLRLFAVYGYYEEPTRLVPTVIKACLQGENPKLLSAHSVRDFIFVEDVIDAFLQAARIRSSSGEIYNVGSGKQYSVSQLVSKIIELTHSNVQPLWGKAQARAKREPSRWVSDNSKIKRDLRWRPKYDLERGLDKTIAWFKKNTHLYDLTDSIHKQNQ